MDKYETGTRHALLHDSPVTRMRAARLAKLAGISLEEMVGQTLFAVHRRLHGILDPELLSLRKISGRMVRRNLATGALEPIARAVVHVEGTEGSFLLYSPPQWADWSWLHPFKLYREEIATATTDEGGYFKVYLPRWEVESVASWRQGRISFGDFSRPRLRDIVRDLDPDHLSESPDEVLRNPDLLARCRRKVGRALTDEIEAMVYGEGLDRSDEALEMLLETPVVPDRPHALDDLLRGALRTNLAAQGSPSEQLKDSANYRSIGPVWHSNLALRLWTLLLDVPDITFRVTRGNSEPDPEEVLYSDGFFDVPWSRVSVPDFTLMISTSASSKPAKSRAWAEYEALPAAAPESIRPGELRIPRFDSTTVF